MGESFSNFAFMEGHSIILFDGVCNLCNSAVQFVIKRDTKDHFLFASLQSEAAIKILMEHNLYSKELFSILLVEDNTIYNKSTAVLRIAKKLKGLWPLLYGFIIIPKFIRDGAYNFIAKNRYRWFGKKDECMVPTPDLKEKFINQ